ncbi:MAG: M20/M25/M40 family metallo-hydrolase, partial [Erysipelotrichaceae bacterium]|nr:M20/M25/M40 family metallo-hydrolase [Erysipelotrichaceae bacterium]
DFLNCKYGAGSFEIEIIDTYYNMKELILPHKEILERAEKAFRKAGISTTYVPIRGGTDGAMLSYQGLPCPNLSTGGGNFHSIHEYASVNEMEKMVEVLINIATSL